MNKFLTVLFLVFGSSAFAQEPMAVIRCTAPELQTPIQNIFVDKENKKWVGNSDGLFEVHAIDFATPYTIQTGNQALLKLPNGNNNIQWSKSEMSNLLDGEEVTAAFYDTKSRELLIGTSGAGIYRLSVKPSLKKVGKIDSKNSKLKSDNINAIAKDRDGRLWIGTDAGVLVGTIGKWKLLEKFFSIEAVSINRGHIWLMGDETVWKVEEGDELYPIDIDERMVDGAIKDIAADSRGRVWIASEIVARYNFDADAFQAFGPAQYFTSQDVNYIEVDKDDALWIGTQDKGLFLVEKASAITVTALVDKGLSCEFTQPDAALKVRVTGGQPPYFYKWDQGLKGEKPAGLGAGTYAVTVTDDKGKTKSAKVTVPNPKFTLKVAQDKEESGAGKGDAQAIVSIEGGGLPEFSYEWDNGETTAKAIKLTEGNHNVTVTDKNGCTAIGSVLISQKISPLNIEITQTAENNCPNESKAALEVSASGGKAPYQYKWNKTNISGETPANLGSGQYGVTVSDARGLTSTGAATIKEVTAIEAAITIQAPASTGNADGKATVKASGGNGSFTYEWDNGETTAIASKLSPTNHTVTVTDAKGCQQTAIIDISENILAMAVTVKMTKGISCKGENEGVLAASVSGGKPPYKFKWNTEAEEGETISKLSAGAYSVTVSDVTGTEAVAQVTIEEPEALTATITVQASASTGNKDGKATVKVTGGTGKYNFKWDNNEADKTAKTLGPGTHSVTVTDEAGCTVIASAEITENILPLNVSIEQTQQIDCNKNKSASLQAEVNGGKGPFSYVWSEASAKGETPTNLGVGLYTLTVTDATGTSVTDQITINEPTALTALISVQQPASTGNADGKALASANGGNGKFSFKWDNGETEKTATKLAPGTHTLTVTDGNGCTTTATIDITENVLPLTVSINQTKEIKCFEAKTAALAVQVSGGKTPFQYAWSKASAKGEAPTNLGAGTYQLTITDAKGQSKTSSVTINEPSKVTARITAIEPASDKDSNDGAAKLAADGGAGNFTFNWDNGETSQNARKLSIGSHQVTVTDANGCATTAALETKKRVIPELRIDRIRLGQVIRLSDLNFDADSTVLRNESMPILDEIAYFLEQNSSISIEIGGHTNGVPPHEYCDALSSARAKSITTYISSKGIKPERVIPKGYGKRKPIASNKTPDGRKRNQRVELKILTIGGAN